jgi:predicted solute-binding protein
VSERPRFDLIRACFLLIAIVTLTIMAETAIAMFGCVWVVVVAERQPLGECGAIATTIRELMAELLTTILALLVAARPPPPKE